MPWWAISLLIGAGVILVVGVIYVLFWTSDVIVGGALDDLRDMRRDFIGSRIRRRLGR